jgi:sulfur carrier protein
VTLRVNGETISVEEGLSLRRLIERLKLDGRLVAVELNRDVVPRSRFEATALKDGDCLEIVTFVGGG